MTFAFHFRRPSVKALNYFLGISRAPIHRFNPSVWDLNAVRIICSPKNAVRMITTKKDEVQITKTEGGSKGGDLGNSTNDGCCGGSGEGGNNKEGLDQEEILSIQVRVQELHRHANYAEALELSEVLIQRCETAFGLNHPATASSYNNAAVMHKLLGNYNQARSRYNDALKVYQKVLGHDHSSTASTLNNIGNLDRAQVHYDDNLSREEQSRLLQSSIDYIQQALTIRQNELGNDHPHTVTSRSNLGSSLAAQFLFAHHQLEKNNSTSSKGSAAITTKISMKYNEEQREMAEHHLRSALQLALQNQSQVVKNNNDQMKNVHNKDEKELDVKITSLSAAAAAQNLAVFLKVSADMSSTSQSMEFYMEAKWLYEQALQARKEKLGSQHPELIATMSSLAELKATIGDEEGATAIRREILQTLDPKLLDNS